MTNTILQPFPFNHGITWLIKALLFLQLPLHATAQSDATAPPPNPFSFNPKFNSSMAIIMVILVSAFFFLGFFSVYIRQCAARRMRRSFNPDTIGGGTRQVARGLDVEIIETFPTFIYSAVKGLKIGKGLLECAVCLNEFEDDETLRLLPKCNHVFHHDCIDAWLVTQSTCPVCRANLIPKPGEIHTIHLRLDSDSESVEPGCTPNRDESINQVSIHVDDDIQSVSHVKSPIAMNRPPRSRSTGFKLSGIFPRSHSTGHSLVRPGESYERFTLRLPEEVRTQIMNSSLNRTKSCVAFQRVRSSRRSYRSGSVGSGWGKNYYERFDGDTKTDRWGLSMTPPFILRNGSVRSMKVGGGEDVTGTSSNLIKSVKSPFECLFPGVDGNSGSERLFDRPRSDGPI